jgi:uncharacterized protein
MGFLWLGAGSYVLLVVLVAIFQRQLVYLPTILSMDTARQLAAQRGVVPWLNARGEIIGWRMPARSPAQGSVLIVHGNGGTALRLSDLAASIRNALNLDVYLLEYPGYGQRGGTPSEASLLAAADEGWELIPTNRPEYVVSESLGTGVAAHLAQQYPAHVAGLLMFVPYDRLASVAQNHYPYLPAYLLLQDRFAPVDWLADYHGPVKIVLAGADEIIPIARGQALYDGYRGPKSLQIIPGASHGDTIEQPPQWWREVMEFWREKGPGLNSESQNR